MGGNKTASASGVLKVVWYATANFWDAIVSVMKKSSSDVLAIGRMR